MKVHRTVQIVALLIISLMVSPVMSYSTAHAMPQAEPVQKQHAHMTSSPKCHQAAEKHHCKHCAAKPGSSCCQHQTGGATGGNCDNSCSHVVASATITLPIFNISFNKQEQLPSIEKLISGIEPDTQLRPPQFA